MGKAIEAIASQRGHQIVQKITSQNKDEINQLRPKDIDVCIEFTSPESATSNLSSLLSAGMKVVCGTTGWYSDFDAVIKSMKVGQAALLTATNFSPGVNIFFAAAQHLAHLIAKVPGYDTHISETHHTEKKDAPSGTAITLESLVRQQENMPIPITSHRIPDVPGIHELVYSNEIDELSLRHSAFSRQGFALGAVLAAEFLQSKTGIYTMNDVFQFNS